MHRIRKNKRRAARINVGCLSTVQAQEKPCRGHLKRRQIYHYSLVWILVKRHSDVFLVNGHGSVSASELFPGEFFSNHWCTWLVTSELTKISDLRFVDKSVWSRKHFDRRVLPPSRAETLAHRRRQQPLIMLIEWCRSSPRWNVLSPRLRIVAKETKLSYLGSDAWQMT